MKKWISILLTVAMLVCFAACFGETGNEGEGGNKPAYTFLYKGQTVAIRANAKPVLDALGSPFYNETLPTCYVGDQDKLFAYESGGVKLMTYQMDGVDYFYQIELLVDLVTTREGISVGNAKQAVLDAYGEPSKTDASCLTYEAEGMQLEFSLDSSDCVRSIVYRYR